MPLMADEVAQCQSCERYVRLGDLLNVRRQGDEVQKVVIDGEHDERYDDGFESAYLGDCPHCLRFVYVRNIT